MYRELKNNFLHSEIVKLQCCNLESCILAKNYLTILINTDKINPINLIRFSKEALTYKLQLAILAKLQNSVIPAVYFVSLGLNGQN